MMPIFVRCWRFTVNRGVTAAILAVTLGGLIPGRCAAEDPRQGEVIAGFLKWQNMQETDLRSYTARRKYVLRATEKGQVASAEVEMTYDKERGESFRVLEWQGAGGLYRFALQKALDSEVNLMRPQNKRARLISEENYQFELIDLEQCSGKACYAVRISPRRKLNALLEGKILVDAKTFALIRVEGKTSSGSFWAGQPVVDQEFCTVSGFQLLQKSDLKTRARGLGETALDIEVRSQGVSF